MICHFRYNYLGRWIIVRFSFSLSLSRSQIERELVLSSADKNSKIPILHEYKQRTAGRVAIAPDAPIKQQAWVQEVSPILPDNSPPAVG